MSIPKFTAEASLSPMTQTYRAHDYYSTAVVSGLYPQWNGGYSGFNWEESLGGEAAMEMAETDAGTGWEESLGGEAAMEMAEDDPEVDVDPDGDDAVTVEV